MKILLAGPVEGHLSDLFNKSSSAEVNWTVCTGSFGVFPDPYRMDRASRAHGTTEFSSRYVGSDSRPINVPVLTIAGPHEDHRFLNHRQAVKNTEILNNVHWLSQGHRTNIGFELDQSPLRVTGLGRVYSESTYNEQYSKKSHRHYTRRDVERACSSGPTDLLVVYEHIDAPGIRNIIYATRPKLVLTVKHSNRKIYPEVQGIPVISLGRQESREIQWEDGLFVY